MVKQDSPKFQGLIDRIKKGSLSTINEEDVLKSKEIKDKKTGKGSSEITEEEVLKSTKKVIRSGVSESETLPPDGITEEDILNSRGIKEDHKKAKFQSDTSGVDLTEEDVLRSKEIKDKNDRLSKNISDIVPETESEPKPKKKVKEITDAEQRKLDRYKKKEPESTFVHTFANDLGCKVATDVLGSDVAYWYTFDCAPLDIVFGGGIPSGKIIECFGWEASGKSTITLEAAKAFMRYWKALNKDNYVVLWLESESALDKVRAEYMGCDLSKFAVREVDTAEGGFDVIKGALEKARDQGLHVFISWDTIAAVLTENEKKGGIGTYTGGIGEKARLIRRLLKDVSTLLGQTNSTLFFVNQMYKTFVQYGAGDEVPGGGGIKFHASIRCLLRRDGPPIEVVLPNGTKITKGIVTDLITKKNKLTLPYQTCKLVMYGESGLDVIETLSRFLILNKYIVAKGGWKFIEFGDEEYKFQNTETLKEILEVKCPELRTYMDYLCYNHYASISPLMKVKLLGKLWELESKLYREKRTKITDQEFSLATLLGRELLEEQDRM